MKRKSMLALLLAVSMTCSMTAATGTVAFASDDAATEEAADDTEAAADDADAADTEEASDDTTEASDDDQKAADEVGALIDKIYVQERTDTTDEDCKAAKEAWDKLTDAQKELVTGEEASPEYFGRDTGDASKDDPRNQDEIGENELLVVSFGTSFKRQPCRGYQRNRGCPCKSISGLVSKTCIYSTDHHQPCTGKR